MRRALAAALGGAAALLLLAGTAEAALEPVGLTANAPGTVTAGTPFKLEVSVEAEAGVLDIAAQPLLVGVKLAPECGGSLVGTPGAALLERTLTVPAGAAVAQTFSAEVTASAVGTEVLCAYLQDSQERQFATDAEAEVTIQTASTAAAHQQQCTTATKRATVTKRSLKRLDRRIARVRHRMRHAHGHARKALKHSLHKLRSKRRKLARQRRLGLKTTAGTCS